MKENKTQWLLLATVFVIATCGLIYELVAGTLASYVLGDSVTQFSTIIGVYLFSMGIGSFLSKYFSSNLLQWFIRIELLVGFFGGFSAAILFLTFPVTDSFRIILYTLVSITGILVGLEIPLLMRILKDVLPFKDLVSRVFTFDYIGALLASIIFPLILIPSMGLIRTSLFFGMINIAVGAYLSWYFAKSLRHAFLLKTGSVLLLISQLIAFVFADEIMNYSETQQFNEQVVYARSSPYQRIVITRNKMETRMYLNGNLQFSSKDEYRYHEALVHPALSSVKQLNNVLVLGGGDGMAVREILKYPSVQSITLIDLDAAITGIFSTLESLKKLNQESLLNPKLKILNEDAFIWLKKNKQQFDAIVIDFPDPSNYSLGKLYSTVFYSLVKNALSSHGVAVVQSTSPFVAPNSFWCVQQTIAYSGFQTKPYHNLVPSFGDWGYILFYHQPPAQPFEHLPASLKFIDSAMITSMFIFTKDMLPKNKPEINRLNNQALVHYFEEEWSKYLD